MTESKEYILIGFADPLGLKTGFLIPVFTKPRANALVVEQVGPTGKVSGFEFLDPQHTNILSVAGGKSNVDGAPHWGFGLGKQLLFGQGDENREQLEAALDTPFLEKRPMLSLEVAEFLGLRGRRIELAKRVFSELPQKDEVAERWRDATILTTDLREALVRKVYEKDLDFSRLVARVDGNTVFLAGLDKRAGNLKIIRSVVAKTMRSLEPLYPTRPDVWEVEFVNERFRERRNMKDKLGRVRGLVYVADEDVSGFPEPDIELVDGLRIFQPWQYDDFEHEAGLSGAPTFILYTLREHLPSIPGFASESSSMWPLGVALRDNVSPLLRSSERHALNRYSGQKIIIGKPPAIFTSAGIAGELRDALNFMADAHRSNLNRLPFETGVFLRSRGNKPNQETDAWLQIYERCVRIGIQNPIGVKLESINGSETDTVDAEALFLPGLISLMIDRTKFSGRRAIDAAAVVKFEDAGSASERQNLDRTIEFMGRLGFNLDQHYGWVQPTDVRRGAEGFEIRVGHAQRSSNVSLDNLFNLELGEVRRLVLVEEADPTAVLVGLADRRELLLTLRDFAVLNGPTPNVWVLLGSQMRRFASSVASKGRTYYFAILIEAARHQDRLPSKAADLITDMLHSGRLGSQRHIITSQATFENGLWSLVFRFIDRLATSDDSNRYRLSIDADGPFVTLERPIDSSK